MPKQPQDRKPKTKKAPKSSPSNMAPGEQDTESKYSPSVWGSAPENPFSDLEVPSGQTCLVRRPGVEGLMKAGVLQDLDSLSAIVDQKHIRRVQGKPEVDTAALLKDGKSLENVIHVAERITCYVVVKPEVHMTPDDSTRREPGKIYADMIDLEDKMFILNYAVGGTRDLERFRAERAEALGSVEPDEDVPQASE